MKRKLLIAATAIVLVLGMTGCDVDTTTHVAAQEENEETKLSFVAEFYDNNGGEWLSVEGTSFDISPNKVKEYYYDSSGSWISGYTTSSVVSIDIDGKSIETCGSTVIFYDTRLEKIDTELPDDVVLSQGDTADITVPEDLRARDMWTLNWWWMNKDIQNDTAGERIVVIQSQLGDPICMFTGNEVTWDVSKNLPKTTEVCIDGKMVYIHRANFAIIDAGVFE